MSDTSSAVVDPAARTPFLTTPAESLRKACLAGLGACSLTAKASASAVAALVRESQALGPKVRQQLTRNSSTFDRNASAAVTSGTAWIKERIVRPLDFLVLATRRDVEQLTSRVVQLATEIQKLAADRSEATTPKRVVTTEVAPQSENASTPRAEQPATH